MRTLSEATKKTSDKDLSVSARKGGPVQFFSEVRREMSKVTWPSWKETYLTTMMVFIMVGITMMFFFGIDWILAMGERWLIGALG
jgi:preprotein translocase subunit SecE